MIYEDVVWQRGKRWATQVEWNLSADEGLTQCQVGHYADFPHIDAKLDSSAWLTAES